MLPQPGSYRAKQNGTVIVRVEESGSMMAYIPYMLVNCNDVANFTGVHNLTLCSKDGTPQKKNVETLKSVFPDWDIDNLADIELPTDGEAPQFDLADCYRDDSYTPDGAGEPLIQFKAKWFNAVGGGVRKQPMTDEERKKAIAKYRSKFKALGVSGKSSAAAEEEPKTKTAPGKKAPPAPAPKKKTGVGGQALTATMDEAFVAFDKAHKGETDDEITLAWYAALDEKFGKGTSENPDLTIQQWGELKAEIEAG